MFSNRLPTLRRIRSTMSPPLLSRAMLPTAWLLCQTETAAQPPTATMTLLAQIPSPMSLTAASTSTMSTLRAVPPVASMLLAAMTSTPSATALTLPVPLAARPMVLPRRPTSSASRSSSAVPPLPLSSCEVTSGLLMTSRPRVARLAPSSTCLSVSYLTS